jgi:pyruvate kinase
MVVIERLAEGRDRRTKIIATIRPATSSEEALRELLQAWMNVARLNFSHGVPKEHLETIQRLRRLAAELEIPVAILQDLPRPKVRIARSPTGRRRSEPGRRSRSRRVRSREPRPAGGGRARGHTSHSEHDTRVRRPHKTRTREDVI